VAWAYKRNSKVLPFAALLSGMTALAACSSVVPASGPLTQPTAGPTSGAAASSRSTAPAGSGSLSTASPGTQPTGTASPGGAVPPSGGDLSAALPAPAALPTFPGTKVFPDLGRWQPVGRLVHGKAAVYETLLVPPGDNKRVGIAWMDTHLLAARLYSGSMSPGGGPYKYTAPVTASAAKSLVAAFNGGFQMGAAHGGYYTEGRVVRPLVRGAASLVIYANGLVTVGDWGSDVTMTPSVVAVRQNLYPLVANGEPTALAATRHWRTWGGTCPCGAGQTPSEYQWRSGVGVTADGALVYVNGPVLDPLQVAQALVRAGAVRGMQLDINPTWPVFAAYKPAAANGEAAPANGATFVNTYRGPATFFDPKYARDFITMSARSSG